MRKINAKIMLLSVLLFCYPIAAREVDFSGRWPNPMVFDKIGLPKSL